MVEVSPQSSELVRRKRAGSAGSAGSTVTAGCAASAGSAATAGNAGSAGSGGRAATAGNAGRADRAATAGSAASLGEVRSAGSAGSAATAGNAGSAGSGGRAATAGSAASLAEVCSAGGAAGVGRRGEQSAPVTTVQVRRVPQCEPPYDDDAGWDAVIPGQLALDWSPEALARAGIVPGPTAGDESPGDGLIRVTGAVSTIGTISSASTRARELAHRRPAVAGVSTDAKIAVHRFVRHCVEVLNGYRPAGHLRPLALPAEAATIVAQGLAGARRVANLRKAAPGPRVPRRSSPAAVMRLLVCQPSPEAVEAAAALVTSHRTWALALRLELHHETWSATALRLI